MSKPAEMYACIYAKEFPAQAMSRLRPELWDRPCAILDGEPPTQRIYACNSKARMQGVVYGMTKVEVDTFPSVVVLPRSLKEEAAARAAMLECAGTFSPSIEDWSSANVFCCAIDISGTDKLHGPSARLGKALYDRSTALGVRVSVAIASNLHAAVCLARGMWSKKCVTVIAQGAESTELAKLPLHVLNLSQEQAEVLSLWGIHTLGMLAGLPEKPLIARMGQAGKRLRQLACGDLPHLFVPIEAAFALEEYIELDTPVELLDSLLFVVGGMLEQLIVRVVNRAQALASVTVILSLEGGRSYSRTVQPALPSNDRQLWIKLLHLDLEAHPPNAAILSLRLTAEPGRTSKVQLGLFSPQLPESARLDVTLARIRAIVGENSVGSPVLSDTHQPDLFQMKPFAVPSGSAEPSIPSRAVAAMRMIRPAENVTVILRENRPVTFVFRNKRYDVERAYGPWLAEGEWWTEARWGLQQWDLVARSCDGLLLCCCVVRDLVRNVWQMVALYD